MLQKVLPEEAFYKNGGKEGPAIVMTDDSSAERNALHQVWSRSRLLLCAINFLQQLVHAKFESMLELSYKQLKACKIVKNTQNI